MIDGWVLCIRNVTAFVNIYVYSSQGPNSAKIQTNRRMDGRTATNTSTSQMRIDKEKPNRKGKGKVNVNLYRALLLSRL